MEINQNGLHLISGVYPAGAFKQAFGINNHLLVFMDFLSFGPLCNFSSLGSWNQVRKSYLERIFDKDVDYFGGYYNLILRESEIKSAEEIFIWITTGIDDQLFMLFSMQLIQLLSGKCDHVNIITFEKMPDHDFVPYTMGNLSPEDFKGFPTPVRVDPEYCKIIDLAWQALTSETPELINRLVVENNTKYNSIIRCLRLFLRRYPDIKTGLPYWENRMLSETYRYGPKASKIIARLVAGEENDGDMAGDNYLFNRIEAMSGNNVPNPVFELSGALTQIGGTEINLTEVGKKILAGQVSYFDVNPVDHWVGGVHLSSENNQMWLNNNGLIIRA